MRLLLGQDDYVAQFVADGLGINIYPPFVSIGFLTDEGNLAGGVVFNGYNGSVIEMTIFCPGRMNRGIIRAIVRYVFVQLKCNRLYGRCRRDNEATLKLLPRLGFKFKCVLEQHFGPSKSDDAILFSIDAYTASERWINGKSLPPSRT